MKERQEQLGQLIYVSDVKLSWLAHDYRLAPPRREVSRRDSQVLTAKARIPTIVGALERSAETDYAADIDGQTHTVLRQIVDKMRKEGLPDLDTPGVDLREGQPFSFHRDLIFGPAHADNDVSIRALLIVDRTDRTVDGITPGLLMHGSVEHLRHPYRDEEMLRGPGTRSGSATGFVFRWATEFDRYLETHNPDDTTTLRNKLAGRPNDIRVAALSMYRSFSNEDSSLRPPELPNFGPCSGIAFVTGIATNGRETVVVASPVYAAIKPLPAI